MNFMDDEKTVNLDKFKKHKKMEEKKKKSKEDLESVLGEVREAATSLSWKGLVVIALVALLIYRDHYIIGSIFIMIMIFYYSIVAFSVVALTMGIRALGEGILDERFEEEEEEEGPQTYY
ncbi:MAG: hypothetical protein ACTSRU_19385 [Candidatus Hodarchaeales archaeon]